MTYKFHILHTPVTVDVTDVALIVIAGNVERSTRIVKREYDRTGYDLQQPHASTEEQFGEAWGLATAAVDEWHRRDAKGDW